VGGCERRRIFGPAKRVTPSATAWPPEKPARSVTKLTMRPRAPIGQAGSDTFG